MDMAILANYYEFVNVVAIERGAKLHFITKLNSSSQEIHGCIPILSKKAPGYLLFGYGALKILRIGLKD